MIRNVVLESHERVRDWLRARKGEWRQISLRAGVGYGTVCKFESGERGTPRIDTLAKLLDEMQATHQREVRAARALAKANRSVETDTP